MKNQNDLRYILESLENRNYSEYKRIKGPWHFPKFKLVVDHVQGDPFAAASLMRIFIQMPTADFPVSTWNNLSRTTALRDYLTRRFYNESKKFNQPIGTGKGGLITIDKPGQQILDRTSCFVTGEKIEIRFVVGLPANGRRILGQDAANILCNYLSTIVSKSLFYENLDPIAINNHLSTNEDADALRSQLLDKGLIAFIANHSQLPRRTGIDDRPLLKAVTKFSGPEHWEVDINTPNSGPIRGMGIPAGINLIVGGGYHGKSTLLHALERGVYNHIPDDGREKIVTVTSCLKVRSEDGRSVHGVNISPFINNLPAEKNTTSFSTANASGSTSQAASIMEAIEAGAKVLLIDEDTSATNFMIRDRRMQALIAKEYEPITPFADKVKQLYDDLGISTIMVMGGSGDYFESADRVIAMNEYLPSDKTTEAHEIATTWQTGRLHEGGEKFGEPIHRKINQNNFSPVKERRPIFIKTRQTDELFYGPESINLSALEQLVDESQLRAIGHCLAWCYHNKVFETSSSLHEILNTVHMKLSESGPSIFNEKPDGDLATFRTLELAATINRFRSLITTNA